jgi:homopolymeric O-antigen transport system ATP-binding protein
MSEPAIEAEDLGKMYRLYSRPADRVLDALGLDRMLFWRRRSYSEFWALRGLEIEVAKGERLGIIGHNGAGKSTLLKILCGNVRPTEGSFRVRGQVQALLTLGTGFHPEFTGRQNIWASLAYSGLPRRIVRAKEEEIIDFAELEDFIDQPVKTYSAGMYARLAFATATAIEPQILIIDEILGAGDAYFAGKCVERMKGITESNGATVLFVSHDMGSVQRLCTRLVWMERGRIRMAGAPTDVLRAYLDHLRDEQDLRHRAQEMHLSRRRARTLATAEDDPVRRMLFRLRVAQGSPRREHPIYRITLSELGQTLGEIEVGAPMDNSVGHGHHLIDDPALTSWGAPRRRGDVAMRCFMNTGGRDGHAPFAFSVPTHLLESARALELSIVHQCCAGELVLVEMFHGHAYQPLGALTPPTQPMPASDSFPIVLSGPIGAMPQADPGLPGDETGAPPAPSNPRPRSSLPAHAPVEAACRIVAVDFEIPGRGSTRVIPLGVELRVHVTYESEEGVVDPVFGLTIHRTDGLQMDHQNSKLLGGDVGRVQGRGTATFRFAPLRLGIGEYAVSVEILEHLDLERWHEPPPAYDIHDRRYRLSVFPPGPLYKGRGAVLEDCEFTLSPGDAARAAARNET